jgi:Flp pilus assembly protein TadB
MSGPMAALAILMVALGAAFVWAMSGSIIGISLTTIGFVLLVVGCAWLLLSFARTRRTPRGRPPEPIH